MREFTPKSTYVPTTGEVETAFHEFASWLESKHPGEYAEAPEFADWQEAMHGFRRWLDQEFRAAKAEAWDEGATAAREEDFLADGFEETPNPYREEATNE